MEKNKADRGIHFVIVPYPPENWKYSNATAATVMSIKVIIPRIFDRFPFTCSPIMVLLLQIRSIITMITGAVSPYSIAEYNNAFIGLIPIVFINSPATSAIAMMI